MDEADDVTEAVVTALARLGAPAVAPLVAALGDELRAARIGAARALGAIGDPRAAEPLARALADDADVQVARHAAHALGKLGDPRALEPLVAAGRHKSYWVRWGSVLGLAELGDRRAVPALSARLQDSNRDVRRSAATALGKLGDPAALPALIGALGDEWWRVGGERGGRAAPAKVAATYALVAALPQQNPAGRGFVVDLLAKGRDPAGAVALAGLLGDDEYVARKAQSALVALAAPAALPALIALLEDPRAGARARAAATLGALQAREAVAGLIARLEDDEVAVRYAAVVALGQIGDDRALAALGRVQQADTAVTQPDPLRMRRVALRDAAGEAIERIWRSRAP